MKTVVIRSCKHCAFRGEYRGTYATGYPMCKFPFENYNHPTEQEVERSKRTGNPLVNCPVNVNGGVLLTVGLGADQ